MLLAWASTAAAQVRVQMVANKTDAAMDDNVVVQITVQAQGGDPEIALPDFDGFEVTQRSVQRPMTFSFGFGQAAQVTSSTNYVFVLQPTEPGQHKIPPVKVKLGDKVFQSQPLVITVRGQGGQPSPAQPAAPGAPATQDPQAAASSQPAAEPSSSGDAYQVDPDAFLRTVVDKTKPFVGEQVTASVYLYTRRPLQQAPAIRAEPGTDGFWVHDLLAGQPIQDPQRVSVNGRTYLAYTLRRFAAFPLRSGQLTIGAMSLTISRESIFDMLDPNRAQPNLDRSAVPLLVDVQELPAEGKPAGDVAVGKLEVSAQLDRAQVATGDAVTLTATVKGEGNIAGVKLATPVVQGLDVLQPETHELIEAQQDVITGTHSYAWLIVPRQPGTYVIPEIALETFDPKTRTYKRVASPALTLTAAGNAKPIAAAPEPSKPEAADGTDGRGGDAKLDQENLPPLHTHSALARRAPALADQPWYLAALLLGPFAWLGSVLVPAARRRLRQREGSEGRERAKQARKRFDDAQAALAAGDASQFHAQLAGALVQLVAARLDANIAGMTRNETRALLAEQGVPESSARELLELLERCEIARFSSAGSDAADMQQALERARALFDTLSAGAKAQGASV